MDSLPIMLASRRLARHQAGVARGEHPNDATADAALDSIEAMRQAAKRRPYIAGLNADRNVNSADWAVAAEAMRLRLAVFLEPTGGASRNRLFEAPGVLSLLTRYERSVDPLRNPLGLGQRCLRLHRGRCGCGDDDRS